jgi:uncharacterized membrane protein YgcG
MRGPDPFEYTEAGTSIMDNLRLYVNEINPRRPSARATDTIGGNIRAGFSDAEDDLVDAMRHGFTGRYEKNLHTGRVEYHPSPFTAVPLAMASIVRWQPLAVTRTSFSATEPAVRMLDAIQILFAGAESAVRMGGDLVSAVSNGVLNPVFQSTVGLASPGAADLVGDSIGAVAQAAVKNLPFGERSIDALSPMSLLHHDRAFAPALYTRTDLQLNIDRAFTIMDMAAINAIRNHNESNDSDGGGQESGGNGDGGDGNGSNGGGGNGNGGNGGGGCGLFDGDCGLWDRDKDWIDIDIDIDICGDGPD